MICRLTAHFRGPHEPLVPWSAEGLLLTLLGRREVDQLLVCAELEALVCCVWHGAVCKGVDQVLSAS